jgi:ABC-type antimicrobial peptide transport system permease subunit
MEFEDAEGILDIVRIPMLAILVVVIFFIAYFVTRLILKSRDIYFSIVRMLGMSKKNVKRILDIEILTVGTLAFALFVLFGQIVSHDIIQIEYIKYLVEYLTLREYAAIYLVIILMAYLISSRAARKLFTASAMGAYRGEA